MPFLGISSLKDLIRSIRAAKTAADERAVIAKESASIRASFREEAVEQRPTNVAKMLYIHMLGYPAHFGQMECVKLVASQKFHDKRLGYLGIMLLLDENQEVLTLVTNSIKNDLNHSNMYIVGLALCTLGNISSPEMARDLCDEVEKLLQSSNSYIRKKAALSAVRIIRKVPELCENFTAKVQGLLTERNHGVMLTGITLMVELCILNPAFIKEFKPHVRDLVGLLKTLSTSFSPEHDVSGITDPFLQVKILRFLRILGRDDQENSEFMTDVLAQVATNTESSKNVGNSILYEAVLTIMDIKADSGLRVMAINILGKFLSNKDNNTRYVALNTLIKAITLDSQAVQRHRSIILECLHDPDISIRKRALDLAFALINDSNIRLLIRELLGFLEVADTEFKQPMTSKICSAAEKFAPNKRWHIDTVLKVLSTAGNYVREENIAGFIRLVGQSPDLQAYAVKKAYGLLKTDISQDALVNAGIWLIGEYGDILIQPGLTVTIPNEEGEDNEVVKNVKENDAIELIEGILNGPYATFTTKELIVNALIKLTARFGNSGDVIQQRLSKMILNFTTNLDAEVQQRAVEYSSLLAKFNASTRAGIVDRIPVPEWPKPEYETRKRTNVDSGNVQEGGMGGSGAGSNDNNLLLELSNLEPGTAGGQGAPAAAAGGVMDLMADIFGGAPAQPANVPAPTSQSGGNALLDLLGGSPPKTSSIPVKSPDAGTNNLYVIYNKDGLRITMVAQVDPTNPTMLNIQTQFYNDGISGGSPISELVFQAAVPKTLKLQLSPPSGTDLAIGGTITQIIRISNPTKAPVKLRLKINYTITSTGQKVEELAQFSGFPDNLMG